MNLMHTYVALRICDVMAYSLSLSKQTVSFEQTSGIYRKSSRRKEIIQAWMTMLTEIFRQKS